MSPSTGYALITGASSGIGECFARALAAKKLDLILVARSRDKLRTLAEELAAAHGVKALPLDYDLSVLGASSSLAAELDEKALEVDLLINNAGFGGRGEFAHLPLDRQAEMIQLNARAVVELTHLLVPPMVSRRHGGIINVSSLTSFQPVPYAAIYSASKAFVTSFSMALAEELRPHGIRVVTLCPGGTRTHFVEIGRKGRHKFPGSPQTPDKVVEAALKKLSRGGGLVVPRFKDRLAVYLQRFVPKKAMPKLVGRFSKP